MTEYDYEYHKSFIVIALVTDIGMITKFLHVNTFCCRAKTNKKILRDLRSY